MVEKSRAEGVPISAEGFIEGSSVDLYLVLEVLASIGCVSSCAHEPRTTAIHESAAPSCRSPPYISAVVRQWRESLDRGNLSDSTRSDAHFCDDKDMTRGSSRQTILPAGNSTEHPSNANSLSGNLFQRISLLFPAVQ